MKTQQPEKQMELLINSANGIYIPRIFATTYGAEENFENWDEIKDLIDSLANVESFEFEDYWDTWEELVDNAKLKDGFTLYHNEDLWAVPEGFEWDEFDQ